MPRMPSVITLTHPTAGAGATPLPLSLPPELLWTDQYGWKSIEMVTRFTSTGALWVDSWPKQAGQPITLAGTQQRAWCERGSLATLRTWADDISLMPTTQPVDPAQLLKLNHRGTVYLVVFDHQQQAIEAEPLSDLLQGGESRYTVRNEAGEIVTDVSVDYFNPQPTDPLSVTLRFLMLGIVV
jgi:hypothetical protein